MTKHLLLAIIALIAASAQACPQVKAEGRGITARVQDIGGSSFGVSGGGIDIKAGVSTGTSRGVGAQASTSADRNYKTCGQCQKIGAFSYGTKRGLGVSSIAESSATVERSHGQQSHSSNVDATRNAADNFSDLRIDQAQPALPKLLAQ